MWRTKKFDESVVVLGAGFAGIECARRLSRLLRRRPSTHLALVDKENYFVFQPLLPEVASASIAVTHVANPVRQFVPDVDFDCAEVLEIDLAARKIVFLAPEGMPMMPMPFTHLVIALGTQPNMGVIPGMAAHGLAMKTVGDAFHLRNHLVTRLELAANTLDPHLRAELLTIVTVGGGFSGVETCAEVHDMMEAARRWYPELAGDRVRSVLVAATDRILPALSTSLSQYALDKLRQRGVEVVLDERVTSVTPHACFLKSGGEIHARTVVSTVGDSPHALLARLDLPKERGRLLVDENLRVVGTDNVWAVGDCAWAVNGYDGKPCPPTAQFSSRQGAHVADNVAAALDGRPLHKFAHKAQGYLASLGHRSAVAEIMGIKLSGFVAWWVWRTIYLAKLPGVQRKVRVAIDWTLDLLFPRDFIQLQVGRTDRITRQHYEAGQTIIMQGEVGEAFYMIAEGEVDVLRTDDTGDTATLARLGHGAYFGQEALLTGRPRSATVRAVTPVDVLVLGRSDFTTLAQNLTVIQEAVQRLPPSIERPPDLPP